MGLAHFILMVNNSQSGSLQPPPVDAPGPDYFVSAAGTGDGTQLDPMSPADFLLLTLVANDTVYFNAGDTF